MKSRNTVRTVYLDNKELPRSCWSADKGINAIELTGVRCLVGSVIVAVVGDFCDENYIARAYVREHRSGNLRWRETEIPHDHPTRIERLRAWQEKVGLLVQRKKVQKLKKFQRASKLGLIWDF